MLLLLLAGFFFWLLIRDLRKPKDSVKGFEKIDRIYRLGVLGLGLLCLYPLVQQWQLNRFLTDKAVALLDGAPVSIHCDTAWDAIFEHGVSRAGSAYIEQREIVFHYTWCDILQDALDDPEDLNREELFSLHVFTHEVMHIRGERNEKRTDCQAVQRNYRAALLLGLPEYLARKHSVDYYLNHYPKHPYYSANCYPGGPLDEKLKDSTWQFL